jgi:tetratricopeptide (TPR) repeat protein
LGWIFGHSGKFEAGRRIVKKIQAIDPLSLNNQIMNGLIDLFEGNFNSAIKSLGNFQQMEPENPFYRFWYGMGLAYNQNLEEAQKIFNHIIKDTPGTLWEQLSLFFIKALKGEKTEALKSITKKTQEIFRNDEMFPIWMAEGFALIDEKDEAIDWLEHGVNWGFINYPFLNEYDPFLENIRKENRFKNLMEKVKHKWENFEV